MSDTDAQWCCTWHRPASAGGPPKPSILGLTQVEVWWFPEWHGRWSVHSSRDDEIGTRVEVESAQVTWRHIGGDKVKWALDKLIVMVKDPLTKEMRPITCSMAILPEPPVQVPPLWVTEVVKARLKELNS